MIRTLTIPSTKLNQFMSELGRLGDSITEKGGKVVVDDAKGTVEFEGISMKITGSDPYTLIIEGDNSKLDDVEYLVRDFSKYR